MNRKEFEACVAEIRAVIAKHNCGAIVVLADPGKLSYVFSMPTWSVIQPLQSEDPEEFSLSLDMTDKDVDADQVEASYHLTNTLWSGAHDLSVMIGTTLRDIMRDLKEAGALENATSCVCGDPPCFGDRETTDGNAGQDSDVH